MSYAVAQYKTARLETATPAQMVVAMYDGALRFLRQAVAAEKDPAKRGLALNKAHAVISELQVSLEADHAPELCAQLEQLYDFVLHRITSATVNAEMSMLLPAISVLQQLRASWAKVAEQQAR